MMRTATAALAATVLFALAAPASAQTMVREVEVEVDIAALQNEKAATRWATLSDDLKNAVAARLVDRIADDGVRIRIDVDELSLASSFESAAGVADSAMKGNVVVSSETDYSLSDGYDLTVAFADAGPFFAAGTDLATLTSDSQLYYEGMVSAFADAVVKNLK